MPNGQNKTEANTYPIFCTAIYCIHSRGTVVGRHISHVLLQDGIIYKMVGSHHSPRTHATSTRHCFTWWPRQILACGQRRGRPCFWLLIVVCGCQSVCVNVRSFLLFSFTLAPWNVKLQNCPLAWRMKTNKRVLHFAINFQLFICGRVPANWMRCFVTFLKSRTRHTRHARDVAMKEAMMRGRLELQSISNGIWSKVLNFC